MRYSLTGRLIFNLVYAAMQAFMSALAAWFTARMLGSAIFRKMRRLLLKAIRFSRAFLYATLQVILNLTVRPVVRAYRYAADVARDAAEEALVRRVLFVFNRGLA